MSDWQPIETAPKDGTRILVWVPADNRSKIGHWDTMRHHTKPKPYWSTEGVVMRTRHDRECPPSHWMPLPGSPKF